MPPVLPATSPRPLLPAPQLDALVAAGNVTAASGLELAFSADGQVSGGRAPVRVIPVGIPAGDATVFLLDGFVEPPAGELQGGTDLKGCKCILTFCHGCCGAGVC